MSLYEFQFCMASTNSVYLTSHPVSHKCVLFFYTLPKIYIWFFPLLLIKIFKYSTILRPLLYTLPTYSSFLTKGFMCFSFLWPLKKYIYPTTSSPPLSNQYCEHMIVPSTTSQTLAPTSCDL